MHFFKTLVGAAIMAATVAAQQLAFTSAPTNVEQGVDVTFTWTAADSSPVTINLMKGATDNLQFIMTIADGVSGTSYTWTPPAKLVSDTDYAFEITQGSESNYWGPVVLNASLEPGSSTPTPYTSSVASVPTATATPTVVTTAISSSPAPVQPTVVPAPANTTIPPPPSSGASSQYHLSAACLAVLIGAAAAFL